MKTANDEVELNNLKAALICFVHNVSAAVEDIRNQLEVILIAAGDACERMKDGIQEALEKLGTMMATERKKKEVALRHDGGEKNWKFRLLSAKTLVVLYGQGVDRGPKSKS